MIDSRAARVLAEGRRDMVDDEEWQWIAEHARGAFDHLIIASTLPVFMTPGIDGLEAWNEAVCSGAWGRLAARAGEKLRRALDLEHWPAFQRSFRTMVELLHELAEGPDAPGTISFIGGDVHTAYVAEVALGRASEEPRLPDRLLAVPQPARSRASGASSSCWARVPPASSRARSRARAGVRRPDVELASRDARDVRQLGRRARTSTSAAPSSRSGAARPRPPTAGRSRSSTSAT